MSSKILVALGGNALKKAHERGTTEEQLRNADATAQRIAQLVRRMRSGDRLIITHGNGPQVGNLLIQQDCAKGLVPPQRMDVAVAMTQGQLGYLLQQCLQNRLMEMGIELPVLAVINQVLVDEADREFSEEGASKPIGEFLSEEEARRLKEENPTYIVKKVKPQGDRAWRRVVPSPRPLANVEAGAIAKLVEAGILVIASGGGGIPVVRRDGRLMGVEAVIDKDLAGEILAEALGVEVFIILTDVEKVLLNYGKPDQKPLDRMSLSEAKRYLQEGHFLDGSMKPKVEACIRFLEWGGKRAVISSLERLVEAYEGKAGTEILPDRATEALQ